MAQYAFLYYGEPQFDSPEEGQAHQQKFFAWMRGLGAAVVNPGMPLGPPTAVNAAGLASIPSSARLTGLSIIEADSLEAAVNMAKASPYVEVGGAVHVAEVFQM